MLPITLWRENKPLYLCTFEIKVLKNIVKQMHWNAFSTKQTWGGKSQKKKLVLPNLKACKIIKSPPNGLFNFSSFCLSQIKDESLFTWPFKGKDLVWSLLLSFLIMKEKNVGLLIKMTLYRHTLMLLLSVKHITMIEKIKNK